MTLDATRKLHAAGGSGRVWKTLIRLKSVRSLEEQHEELRDAPRYLQWVKRLEENESLSPGDSAGQMRLLNEIKVQVGPAYWLRWE